MQRHGRHKAALGVVHQVLVPHPLLGLTSNFPLPALLPARRKQTTGAGKVLGQVLHDEGALGQDKRLRQRRRRHRHQRGFPQDMNLFERWRRQLAGQTVVHVELVRDLELFEQPQGSLGSGAIEPG